VILRAGVFLALVFRRVAVLRLWSFELWFCALAPFEPWFSAPQSCVLLPCVLLSCAVFPAGGFSA
jgi:hypothetical protein